MSHYHWTVDLTYAVEQRLGRACSRSMRRRDDTEPATILGWLASQAYRTRKRMERKHPVS